MLFATIKRKDNKGKTTYPPRVVYLKNVKKVNELPPDTLCYRDYSLRT
jgi:hypothetical protein